MDPDSFESLRLLVSELVNNSVKHSGQPEGDPIVLDAEVEDDAVRVEVIDRGVGFTRAPPPVVAARGSGMGLVLVDRLADDWGYSVRDATHVWFELSTRSKVGAAARGSRAQPGA